MSGNKISILQGLMFFFYRFFILRRWFHRYPKQKHPSHHGLRQAHDLSHHTLIFNVEGALLKSNTLFPYFMLVAFEAGGVIRSFLLFVLYPFISLIMSYDMGMKTMVMLSFFGVKKETFRAGKTVLPKYFLEDVGLEMFEVLKRGGKRVGLSDLPQVMIDGFLRDYLGIEVVIGRDMKTLGGYYLGILEDRKKHEFAFDKFVQEEKLSSGYCIGITSFTLPSHHRSLFSRFCQEIYFVRNTEKKSWQTLPRNQYPKPLIFHDGRLAIKPTPINTLALFMWAPFAAVLSAARIVAGLNLPYFLSTPFLAFSGLRLTLTVNNDLISPDQKKGCLFVCNHRTLLDPLYISYALRKRNIKAVTYSLSRLSELLAPIKTVRLTRDRVQDGQAMERLLGQGDLVVCPEGTTCREPYLLRFSPLFAEVSDVIVPVAIDSHVTFFHGTTASGLKAFDPIFFLMDPFPSYTVRLLDPVSGGGSSTCLGPDEDKTKFEVANHVQHEIGKALGFECTNLTRRDKYLILAGNNGVVKEK